jgi:hypothetical protein
VLRVIFGPKRGEVAGDWRRLHNEELHNLYYSGDQIKEDEMGGTCSMHGRDGGCIQYSGCDVCDMILPTDVRNEGIRIMRIHVFESGFQIK